MGTSTVSGPFRSENGFQELVDGVWTPVGGGNSATVIFREASPLVITLPAPTSIGQVYSLIFPWTLTPTNTATILLSAVNGAPYTALTGRTLIYTYSTPVAVLPPSGSGSNAIQVLDSDTDESAEFQIVYMGEFGAYSHYSVVSSTYFSTDTGTSRIINVS
jgi:hypothetical protein